MCSRQSLKTYERAKSRELLIKILGEADSDLRPSKADVSLSGIYRQVAAFPCRTLLVSAPLQDRVGKLSAPDLLLFCFGLVKLFYNPKSSTMELLVLPESALIARSESLDPSIGVCPNSSFGLWQQELSCSLLCLLFHSSFRCIPV